MDDFRCLLLALFPFFPYPSRVYLFVALYELFNNVVNYVGSLYIVQLIRVHRLVVCFAVYAYGMTHAVLQPARYRIKTGFDKLLIGKRWHQFLYPFAIIAVALRTFRFVKRFAGVVNLPM